MGWPQPNIILLHLLTMEHTMRYGDTIVAWKWQKQRWWQGLWEMRWLQGASNSSELGIISHLCQSCRVHQSADCRVTGGANTDRGNALHSDGALSVLVGVRFHIRHHRTLCRDCLTKASTSWVRLVWPLGVQGGEKTQWHDTPWHEAKKQRKNVSKCHLYKGI